VIPTRPRSWLRWPWLRRPALLLAVVAAVTLTGCSVLIPAVVPAIERNDDAALTYVLDRQPRGLEFDPGSAPALGVIVRAEGDDLQLLTAPDGATCTVAADRLDCRLGDVTEPAFIGLSGRSVVANATWRRAGSNAVYLVFATLPEEPDVP